MYEAKQLFDAAEVERGRVTGKPREKFIAPEAMLGVLSAD